VNYPGNVKKNYQKEITYGNRGMTLESMINEANDYYLKEDIAVIYKKPTPIGIAKVDYSNMKITDAYFKEPSTLDYNGLYKGCYIEFDAKETNSKTAFPLQNIHKHQLDHMHRVLNHQGICFLIISINNEYYVLPGLKLLEFISTTTRKSIPYEYIKQNGYEIKYNYLRGLDYIPLLKRMDDRL
jgi:recombination protein U